VKPLERCQDAAIDLHYIIRNFASFHTNLADICPDGYPAGNDGGPSAGISNPTPAVLAAGTKYRDIWREAEALTIELQAGARRLRKLIALYATTELPRLGDRCTGGYGLEGSTTWGEPTCTRNAVTRDGLCDPCRQRQGRWERNRGVA
jgi:hypothetical protein